MEAIVRTLRNIGKLHPVLCDWCGIKMGCSCFFDRAEIPIEAHPMILCPRCQVTEFLNLLHGRENEAANRSQKE